MNFNLDKRNIRKELIMPIILILLGLLTLGIIVSFFLYTCEDYYNLKGKTKAISYEPNIIYEGGETKYVPSFKYEVNGEIYTCNVKDAKNELGDVSDVKVRYDLSTPHICITSYDNHIEYSILYTLVFPFFFLLGGINGVYDIMVKLKGIKKLEKNGILIKGLKYRLEITNSGETQMPVIDYILPDGNLVTLYGDSRYDQKLSDEDLLIDLVIDPDDCYNYYMDYSINRIGGNLPDDYYDNGKGMKFDKIKCNSGNEILNEFCKKNFDRGKEPYFK